VTSSVSDNFGNRTSNGPLTQPDWMKTALAKPLTLHSAVDPVVTTLPNGMRLLVQRVATNPTVFIDGLVRTSPSFDPRGKEGLGEVTSALLDYGSAKYDYDAQRKLADDRAADLSFGTGFSAHGRASDFSTLLDALADDVRHPLLPADKFALVKSQLAAFTGRRALQAGYEAQRLFDAAMYPAGDPALRVPTERSIAGVTLDDVKAYHDQYFRPDLTTLVVVGDVDPVAVRAAVTRAFGDWSATGPKPESHLPPIPLPAPTTRVVTTATQDVTVQLGAPALARSSPDYDPLTLANAIYGANGSLESRLFREVREKRGLVYGAASSLEANRDRGTFTVSFSAVPSKIDAAEALVRSELKRMQTEDVSAEELARAKTRVVATALNAEQATSAIAGDLLRIGLDDLAPSYYATLADRYASITAADVRRAAQTYFHPDNLVGVRIGPPS
jgi:zinc protease